jgi:hypothetical protein
VRSGFLWIGGIFVLSLVSSSTIVAQGVKRPAENIKFAREHRGVSDWAHDGRPLLGNRTTAGMVPT